MSLLVSPPACSHKKGYSEDAEDQPDDCWDGLTEGKDGGKSELLVSWKPVIVFWVIADQLGGISEPSEPDRVNIDKLRTRRIPTRCGSE